jgi:hypothetical protein
MAENQVKSIMDGIPQRVKELLNGAPSFGEGKNVFV